MGKTKSLFWFFSYPILSIRVKAMFEPKIVSDLFIKIKVPSSIYKSRNNSSFVRGQRKLYDIILPHLFEVVSYLINLPPLLYKFEL